VLLLTSSLEPSLANLITIIQDMASRVDMSRGMMIECRQENYRKAFLDYLEMISRLKNGILLYQSYIPSEIFSVVSELADKMSGDIVFWKETHKFLSEEKYERLNNTKADEICNSLLLHVTKIEDVIKIRLTQLSGQQKGYCKGCF